MVEFLKAILGSDVPAPVLGIFSLIFVLCFIVFFISVCRR